MIPTLNERQDVSLVTDNSNNIAVTHVIQVVRATLKEVPITDVITKCIFLRYKDYEMEGEAFQAYFPNKLEQL